MPPRRTGMHNETPIKRIYFQTNGALGHFVSPWCRGSCCKCHSFVASRWEGVSSYRWGKLFWKLFPQPWSAPGLWVRCPHCWRTWWRPPGCLFPPCTPRVWRSLPPNWARPWEALVLSPLQSLHWSKPWTTNDSFLSERLQQRPIISLLRMNAFIR